MQNIYQGQTIAYNWLKSKHIEVVLSDTYKKSYLEEFDNYCKKEDEKRKQLRKMVTSKFGYIKDVYPKLVKQLAKSYDETVQLEPGKDADQIRKKEEELGLTFSANLQTFFSHIAVLKFEGISISFDDLETNMFDSKEYLILGEFWRYGDGDQLLYDPESQSISVFAHEHRPLKIFEQATTMTDFIEQVLVRYLKEYED